MGTIVASVRVLLGLRNLIGFSSREPPAEVYAVRCHVPNSGDGGIVLDGLGRREHRILLAVPGPCDLVPRRSQDELGEGYLVSWHIAYIKLTLGLESIVLLFDDLPSPFLGFAFRIIVPRTCAGPQLEVSTVLPSGDMLFLPGHLLASWIG